MTEFRWGSASDTGRVRTNNQDSALVADELGLFVVADGMGGHQGGEVASGLAVAALREHYAEATTDALVEGVKLANRIVYDRAADDPDLRGMGTTLCAIALVQRDDDELLAIVNVGDSRVYRFESGELFQVSEDHSLVEGMVREGRLSAQEAETHPQRNILTRALGIDAELEVDSWEVIPYAGDRWLLCSDGLFNEVDDARIAATLRRLADPAEAASELVRLANEGGGRDNITAVVVDVVDDGGRSRSASTTVAAEAGSPVRARTAAATTAPVERRGGPADGAADRAGTERAAADHGDGSSGGGRHRRVTWRVMLFVALLLVTLGAAAAAVGWYGRNTYYVAFDDDDVVTIYQGRPGGFLWFDPTVEERTDLERADVPRSVVGDLEPGKDQATLGDAERYVENLAEQSARLRPSTTTTATTATTVPAPTPTTTPP